MPIIQLLNVSDKILHPGRRKRLVPALKKAVASVEELGLSRNQVTVVLGGAKIDPDKMLIAMVDGLFDGIKRTPAVRNKLAKAVGEALQVWLVETMYPEELSFPDWSVEVFVRRFIQGSDGFWTSDELVVEGGQDQETSGGGAPSQVHIIDCDTDPFIPDGWSVEDHTKGGQLEWNPEKIQLWLSKSQKDGGYIEGNKLRKELKSQSVLNANVLDYLLANPHLIPEEWKGKYVCFWGTIYRSRSGRLIVRYLCWRGGGWDWDYDWLGDVWDDHCPAVVCK